jgi:hypothetical protein
MFAFARKAATLRRYLRFLPPQAMLPIGIAGVSFLIDLETPDDIADGFFYIFAVVSCAWVPRVKAALYTACGLLLPMILGSCFSPPTTHGWAGSVNRVQCRASRTVPLAARQACSGTGRRRLGA